MRFVSKVVHVVTSYGFAAGDFNVVTADILSEVENDYYGIPTVSANALETVANTIQH